MIAGGFGLAGELLKDDLVNVRLPVLGGPLGGDVGLEGSGEGLFTGGFGGEEFRRDGDKLEARGAEGLGGLGLAAEGPEHRGSEL